MRQIHLAIVLFLLNTGLTVFWLWDARPRTVATMDLEGMDRAIHERLIRTLADAEIDPHMVRVCQAPPCTDGPAIFMDQGVLTQALLPQTLSQEVD
jgi:hypothetical protein